MATSLDPESAAYFSTGNRRLTDNYQIGLTSKADQQSQTDLASQQRIDNLTSQYNQMRQTEADPYARRGLLNSGIYQAGLDQARGNFLQQVGQQNQAQQVADLGYTHAGQALDTTYYGGLQDLAAQQQARQDALASTITNAQGL